MGKSKGLSAPSKAVDPSLAALFSESVGPARPLPKTRYPEASIPKAEKATKAQKAPVPKAQKASKSKRDSQVAKKSEEELKDDNDDEELSEAEESFDDGGSDEEAEAAEVPKAKAVVTDPTDAEDKPQKRKRKQRDEHDDLESAYFQKLADEDEPTGKRVKGEEELAVAVADADTKEDSDDDMSDVPVHESVAVNSAETELEKATRTVFLANVASETITSRSAKKTLLNHMASVLDKEAKPAQKVESIRFRSTAFSTTSMPKRAAYITNNVMEATTKSTNAYVVYSTPAAARIAAAKLNGTMVLERHLRVDSVAHPAAVDHRRCVFVGNLGMVDDETIVTETEDADGNKTTEKRKRNKIPMDVEEGLWRVFGKEAGKVESVRVIRDPVTRVGQGIAYVQFYDGNDVEKAILLEGKKFPPMLPRALRVSRCKAPHKTKRAAEAKEKARGGKFEKAKNNDGKYVPKPTSQISSLAGRAGKLLGRSGAAQFISKTPSQFTKNRPERGERRPEAGKDGEKLPIKTPEDIIFEGRRASAKDGRPKDLKFKGTKSVKKVSKVRKPAGRGAVRAAKWRSDGKAPK